MNKVRSVIGWIGALAVGLAFIGALAFTWGPTGVASQTAQAASLSQGPDELLPAQLRERGRGALTVAALVKQTAELTGLEPRAVLEAVRGGQSIAQVAAANGSSGQAVVDGAAAKARQLLDRAVANGRMSQAEADARLAELISKANELVNDTTLGAKLAQARDRLVTAALVPAASDVTGLEAKEIRQRMRGGESLAAIISAAGKTNAEVIDRAVEQFRTAAEEALQ